LERPAESPVWMKYVLLAAGAYNLLWGAFAIIAPNALFRLLEMELPRYPGFWQCIGMIIGVYGIGYAIAAFDPMRHWPIVLVGLLGKVFGPIGFLMTAATGELPWRFGWSIFTNDLIWIVPFAIILWEAFRALAGRQSAQKSQIRALSDEELAEMMAKFRDQTGSSLAELSHLKPQIVAFLRHAGCTFCRQALDDLAQHRREIEDAGLGISLVHMGGDDPSTADFFDKYDLGDVSRLNDPKCELYKAFGLHAGSPLQLLGPSVWVRGFRAALIDRHGVGKLAGDGFQMPGLFIVENGRIVAEYRHNRRYRYWYPADGNRSASTGRAHR